MGHTTERLCHQVSYLGQEIFHKVDRSIFRLEIRGVKVLLEVRVAYLITVFKLTIVVSFFLDRIISQVDEFIGKVFERELFGTSP